MRLEKEEGRSWSTAHIVFVQMSPELPPGSVSLRWRPPVRGVVGRDLRVLAPGARLVRTHVEQQLV